MRQNMNVRLSRRAGARYDSWLEMSEANKCGALSEYQGRGNSGVKGYMGLQYSLVQGVRACTEWAYGLMRSAGLALRLLDFGTRQLQAVPAKQRDFHPRA